MPRSLFSPPKLNSLQERRVQFFSGRTRFATSSMATFDGTHPHQWTKEAYSVYDMEWTEGERRVQFFSGHTRFATFSMATFEGTQSTSEPKEAYHVCNMEGTEGVFAPRTMMMKNFITHNGYFEYFSISDKNYKVGIIQEWLAFATKMRMISTVDSCVIDRYKSV